MQRSKRPDGHSNDREPCGRPRRNSPPLDVETSARPASENRSEVAIIVGPDGAAFRVATELKRLPQLPGIIWPFAALGGLWVRRYRGRNVRPKTLNLLGFTARYRCVRNDGVVGSSPSSGTTSGSADHSRENPSRRYAACITVLTRYLPNYPTAAGVVSAQRMGVWRDDFGRSASAFPRGDSPRRS